MNGSSAATTPVLHKLSSLKPARDLTLGGRGGSAGANAAKKVFTPNLNVVRNKNTNVKTSKDTTARGGRGGGRGARGGRGAGTGARGGRGGVAGGTNSALIQTTGVFSEGAGAINIRKTSSSGGGFGGRSADDAPSQMRRPTIIKQENLKKFDLKADEEHVRELLGDTDEDDFGDEKTDLEQIPVKLNEVKWKPSKVEVKLEKVDVDMNGEAAENVEDPESAVLIAQRMQSLAVKEQQQRTNSALSRYPVSVDQLLDLPQSQLLLLQLPDALPCEDDVEEVAGKTLHEKNSVADTPSTSQNSPATKPPTKSLSLKEMEEGKIGKLLRYKSGKVKLVFGNTYFDLNMGMETGFLQELMSINTNREERSGNMINLGPIQAKLTATPDWEHLMEQEDRRQRSKPA
ncbi:DNA-directed RNA polymerase III subunit RPC4 isoform X1 [Ceratitis capitata]|uniref:DNA-directed RNA polymerase III subunit RPC4 isoform X1 n=1 Tax=Ceratitis capitata TaxID=7213 RepID=UPI000329BB6E|nr:DNA-directed RNA polymerase III subunit RPC4 isoform X1 [Ceratitis capitata]